MGSREKGLSVCLVDWGRMAAKEKSVITKSNTRETIKVQILKADNTYLSK